MSGDQFKEQLFLQLSSVYGDKTYQVCDFIGFAEQTEGTATAAALATGLRGSSHTPPCITPIHQTSNP
eukprot:3405327-Amphidinium_carterae.1